MIELLRRFLGPYRAKAIAGILTKVVEVVFEVLTPLVVARMIDVGVLAHDVGEVVRMGVVLLAFAATSYAFTFVCQRLAAQVSQGLGTNVRDALFSRVGALSSAEVDHFGTPSLVTRVTNDVNQVQLAVALGIRTLTRWPLLAAGSMVAALLIDWRLGLVFLVCLPAISATFALVMRASVPFYRAMQAKLDRISLVAREALSGMRVIRAFGQEGREQARARAAIDDQTGTAIGVGRLAALLNPATFAIMNLGVAAILYQGGIQVNVGRLTTGEVMAFVNYMTQTLVSISYLANLVVVIMRGHTSSVRILEVLDCEPSVSDAGNVEQAINPSAPAIELVDVGFSYGEKATPTRGTFPLASEPRSTKGNVPLVDEGRAAALEGISLALPAGGTLGVIGGTGSGKSTLVRLLPRLYDAGAGCVRIFGHDVRDYPLAQLRHLVSVVPQDVSLVSGTLRDNLSWRDPGASDDELWAALTRAQAAEFVRALPQGLDAPVEAGGRNFSGGQRQRLTIARALVGTPRIVALDDAASALDFATDARLRAELRALSREVTSVIVSQRVSAVRGADLILVLDHGHAAGLGTHDELLEASKLYRQICASQSALDEYDTQRSAGRGEPQPTVGYGSPKDIRTAATQSPQRDGNHDERKQEVTHG